MTEYAYKMEGLDKNWTYLTTNRKAYFTELSPGTYTFTVKASINSGVWNANPASLTIKILPPFWESFWAYLLYTAAVALAIIFYVMQSLHKRNEEKNKRKLEILEHEKEKEIYQAKIEFFTHVAHEIRTPLTLIIGPLAKIMKNAGDVPAIKNSLQIMQRNADRMMELTTQLLDFRKTEINRLSPAFCADMDITELLRDNFARFKPTAEQNNLHFEMKAPSTF